MSVRTLLHHHRQASRTVPDTLVTLLCDRHAAALYRLALTLAGDPDLAEQAVVDVLAAALHTRTTATHATTPRRLTDERRELIEAVYHRCQRTPDDHVDSIEAPEDTIAAIGLLGIDTSDLQPNPHAHTTPARTGTPALGRLSDRHPAPTDRGTTRRAVPQPGQRVRLGPAASPQFRQHPITLLITSPVRPSTVDSAQRHQVAAATWWLITGWELGPRQQPVLLREVSVRAAGIDILPAAIPVTPEPFI